MNIHIAPASRREAKRREAKRSLSQGRREGKLHGSHVADIVALRKALILCQMCSPKFDAPRNHYHRARRWGTVQGTCDACKEVGLHQLLLHSSLAGTM